MRSLSRTVAAFSSSVPPPARAFYDLFPEFNGHRLAEGLLRPPPRGRRPPVWLSAVSPGDVLAARGWETPAMLAEAATGRAALVAAQVGGAWWPRGGEGALPPGDDLAVVAIETAPNRAAAQAMLDAALAENPAGRVVVLTDRADKRLRPLLRDAAGRGAAVIERPCCPWAVLPRAARVYSDGGETGLLALLAGIPVSAGAAAVYTGWGITDDLFGAPGRPFRRTIDEIFAAICLVATRYRDPFHNRPASFADTLGLLAEWRRIDEGNRRIAACVGMSFWKRRRIADFLRSSAGEPRFCRSGTAALAAARRGGEGRAVAGWASRLPLGLPDEAARLGVPLLRVEDGFIRSVGLGSDFLPPSSLVVDSRGMYFDPGTKSDLELLLRDSVFPPPLVARARRLAARLVARGVTKYNLAAAADPVILPTGRRRILVPGQVEDDLSILRGGGRVRGNLALLSEVRAANPDALIVYKPHPDVLAGHRKGAVPEAEARRFADLVIEKASTAALLDQVEELHTMTSLAGFEALLRGRRVVVYGRPFYAGWGLTEDMMPIDRGRRLGVDELVAGALILYPRYLDPVTRLPCGPEIVIDRLEQPELWRPGPLVLARRLQGIAARRLRNWRSVLPSRGAARLRS